MANLLQMLGFADDPDEAFGANAPQIRPTMAVDPNTGFPVPGPIADDNVQMPQPAMPVNLLEGTPYDQSNVMQMAKIPPTVPQSFAPETTQPATEAPRQRRSLIDTIGHISDVLARVGGAEALYQPTLDAREDRLNALADRQRGIDLDALRRTLIEQQIAAGGDEATARSNAMLGAAVRGLQAVQARGGDISQAWPILARQAGIPEDRAAALGQVFMSDPRNIEAFSTMLGSQSEYGVQPFYARGPDGQLRAYQLGRDGSIRPIQLGEGETPIDPLRFIDTGGAQVGVRTLSGNVERVLPNTVSPDTRANIGSRERISAAGNASRERIAATRGTGSGANRGGLNSKAQARAAQIPAIMNAIDNLEQSIAPLEERGWSGAIGGWVPSMFDSESDVFETNLALVRQLIRSLTRIEGEGSISDYETRLQQAMLPSRTQTREGRRKAIANLRSLVSDLQQAYSSMQQGQGAPASSTTAPSGAVEEARRRGLIP